MGLSAITRSGWKKNPRKQGAWNAILCVYISMIFVPLYSSCNNKATSKELNPQVFENDSSAKENSLVGCLHGESITRKDNFDSIREVTSDNIEKLYSLYDVKSVGDGKYYIVKPKKLYSNARYFSRVIRMENGKQVAACTFYGYSLKSIFPYGNRVLLALNSPSANSTAYKYSFQCKTVLTDNNFVPLRGQMYSPSKGEYAYIDTIYTTTSGYRVEIVDELFDGGEQSRDIIDLDLMNNVVRKRTINNPN